MRLARSSPSCARPSLRRRHASRPSSRSSRASTGPASGRAPSASSPASSPWLGGAPAPPQARTTIRRRVSDKPRTERRRNRGRAAGASRADRAGAGPPRSACPCCRVAMRRIGEDRSERLDVVPAQLRVLVTIRPRYACRRCEEGVHQRRRRHAPSPAACRPRRCWSRCWWQSTATASRSTGSAQILARQGIQLDRATLCDWVGQACWWLRPLRGLILDHVTGHARVFADDTPLPTLERGLGRTRRAGSGPMRRMTAPRSDTGRRRWPTSMPRPQGGPAGGPPGRVPRHAAGGRLRGFRTLANRRRGGSVTLAFCWSHLRRRFPQDPRPQRLADRRRGPAAHRCAVRHRARDPRPAARGAAGRAAGPQRAAGRGAPPLAGDAAGPGQPGLGAGQGDPLWSAALGGALPLPRGRPAGDGHEHGRAGDQAGGQRRAGRHFLPAARAAATTGRLPRPWSAPPS